MSDSKWTPDPVLERESNGVVYNSDGSVKEDTPEEAERRIEAMDELNKYGINPGSLRAWGFYKRWVEVVPNRVYALEYGAHGNNYFGTGTYVVSLDLNRYIKDFSLVDKMWIDMLAVDDHNEIKINGKHMYGYPYNYPNIVRCGGRVSYNNDCSHKFSSLERESSHRLGRIGINFANMLDPDSNIITNVLLVGGRGEVFARLLFEYKDEPEGRDHVDISNSFWFLKQSSNASQFEPIQYLFIDKSKNPHIDFKKSYCSSTTTGVRINLANDNYIGAEIYPQGNRTWEVDPTKCVFVKKIGGEIKATLGDGRHKEITCPSFLTPGGMKDKCYEVDEVVVGE